jgi:hypothetical protein
LFVTSNAAAISSAFMPRALIVPASESRSRWRLPTGITSPIGAVIPSGLVAAKYSSSFGGNEIGDSFDGSWPSSQTYRRPVVA